MKRNGFSFMEVVLSVTLFSLIMTTLISLQGRLLGGSARALKRWSALIDLKNFIVEADQKNFTHDTAVHEKVVDGVSLSFQVQPIAEASKVHAVENLKKIKNSATWVLFGTQQRQELPLFEAVPPQEEKE